MSTLIHADIFFFVTTIAVVVVAAALTVALVYLARVLSDVKKITGEVYEEAVLVRKDIEDLRTDVRREGFRLRRLFDFFGRLAKRSKTRRKK